MPNELTIDRGDVVEFDMDGMVAIRAMLNRIGDRWPTNAMAIIKEKNNLLYSKLMSLQSQLDSLLIITNKPPTLRKELNRVIKEYEQVAGFCIEYANRHIGR